MKKVLIILVLCVVILVLVEAFRIYSNKEDVDENIEENVIENGEEERTENISEGKESSIYASYQGDWKNTDTEDEIIIKKIEDNKIDFEYSIYRTTVFEKATAKLEDNIANFDITNDGGWNIKGTMKLENNLIEVTISESSTEDIQPTTYVFQMREE